MSIDHRRDLESRVLSRTLAGGTVLQIVPALVDDHAARAAVNVAAALLRSGARAIVAASGGPLLGELQALGGEWMDFFPDTNNPIRLRSNARAIENVISTERVDIVHAYSGPSAWSARTAVRNGGAWLLTSYTGAPTPGARFDLAQKPLVQGHRVLVDSGYAAQLISRRYNIPHERIVAIPHSIETSRFDPLAVSAERVAVLRHGWRIPTGARVVFIPGRLASDKGQMTVIDAARILLNGGLRGVLFLIAGDGRGDPAYARALRERIEAQGLTRVIRRIGHCSDMPAAYAMSEMVIIPALQPTTFHQIAAEAHAMARPIVASSIGVLPEVVQAPPFVTEDNRTGWLVEPDDPVELARAIAAVLHLDRHSRDAMGVRARWLAESWFSPASVAASTLGVYTSLLEGEH